MNQSFVELANEVAMRGPDVRFDEFKNINLESQAKAFAALEAVLRLRRKRLWKSEYKARAIHTLGCIIANGLSAGATDSWVHYSRNKSTYSIANPYCPGWLKSKQLIGIIDALSSQGLIRVSHGFRGPVSQGNVRSTYTLSDELIIILSAQRITSESILEDLASAPVVFLNDKQGNLIRYEPTLPLVRETSVTLRGYNNIINHLDISIPPGLPINSSVNFSSTRLRRIYNWGSFKLGGRFYGGWWQLLKKEERAHITINGLATVELDFSGFLPRALYHRAGLAFDSDPYEIPALRDLFLSGGISWPKARKIIKGIFFLLLNAKGTQGLHNSPVFKALPSSISYKVAIEAIKAHHLPIKHRFFSAYFMTLMNEESDICHRILHASVVNGVAILPIHDSFIVTTDQSNWLYNEMVVAYRSEYGHNPIISAL